MRDARAFFALENSSGYRKREISPLKFGAILSVHYKSLSKKEMKLFMRLILLQNRQTYQGGEPLQRAFSTPQLETSDNPA